jgi:hypothetical protein
MDGIVETKSLRIIKRERLFLERKIRYMDASFLKDKFPAFIMEPISEYFS